MWVDDFKGRSLSRYQTAAPPASSQ
jgi:hypothetical protein